VARRALMGLNREKDRKERCFIKTFDKKYDLRDINISTKGKLFDFAKRGKNAGRG